MVTVIRTAGDAHHAKTLNGYPIERSDQIFLQSYRQWLPVLQTSMHFCYKDPERRSRGSTILCTCGAPAAVFGWEAYRKLQSTYIGNEVISCIHYIQYGVHSDGSHE